MEQITDNSTISLIEAILVFIPAILAPFITHYLSKSSLTKKGKELAVIDQRLEVLKKIAAMEDAAYRPDLKKFADEEMEDILHDLEGLREIEQATAPTDREAKPNFISRLFLLYDLRSNMAKIYRGIFYFLLFLSTIGLISVFSEGKLENDRGVAMLGFAVYVGVGFVFRSLALSRYKKITRKNKGIDT